MAGFWNQSQAQIYDANGKPLVNARAYFYLAGTTTPIVTYAAYALGAVNAQPNPLQTDGFGRWPSAFLDEADGFYRVRVTTAQGVIIYDIDGLPIIGPAGGGGGGGDNPVDPNAVLGTGDMLLRYDTGLRPGFVRGNGRTIGSATSGASERANSDTQALFEHLWNVDTTLVVLGGRGGSAAADWAANKQITLPDYRGRTMVGLDTMGNIAANVLAEVTDLSWSGGEAKHLLTTSELPSHSHTGNTNTDGAHTHQISLEYASGARAWSSTSSPGTSNENGASVYNVPSSGTHSHAFTTANTGGGLAHGNVQPSKGVVLYIRL
jgi:microcystin-dependent protein